MTIQRTGLLCMMVATAAVLAVVLGVSSVVHASATKCRGAIVKATHGFVRAKTDALQRCWDSVAAGGIPGSCPDLKASRAIDKAHAKLHVTIAKGCGGEDKTCGGDPSSDESLASIGWNIGVCPDLENGGCTNPIEDCDDVATCVACIGGTAVDRTFALYHDGFGGNPTGDKRLRNCLRTIGKGHSVLLARTLQTLSTCWLAVNKDDSGGSFSCPDPRATVKIAKFKAKNATELCKRCGGPNKACGGGDDVARDVIGFPATCPAIGPCAGPVGTVKDIADCGACVASFVMDSTARSAIPAFSSTSPPHCPAPTPTPGG